MLEKLEKQVQELEIKLKNEEIEKTNNLCMMCKGVSDFMIYTRRNPAYNYSFLYKNNLKSLQNLMKKSIYTT